MTADLELLQPPTTAGSGCDGCRNCPGCAGSRGIGAGEYIVIGADERQRVRPTSTAPFRYICNLENNGWAIGTGTLVGPSTVLTAGHCIHRRVRAPGSLTVTEILRVPSQLRVVPGRDGSLEPLPATRAARFVPFPGYRRATRTDVGLIHLANPIGRRVGWWRAARAVASIDPVGTSMAATLPQAAGVLRVNVSGYPADLPSDSRLGCRVPGGGPCRHSTIGAPSRDRSRCGTEQWRAYDRTVRPGIPGLLRYVDDTCPGHSGSPVWVRRHPSMGGRVLVGVHIARSPDNRSNRAVQLTPTILRWIRDNTI